MSRRHSAFAVALETIGAARIDRLLAPFTRGLGVILTLHHVRPARDDAFAPNRILEITPEFLDAALSSLRRLGYELVTLDEALRRLDAGGGDRPFAALTFDDGYRDNLAYALPVLERHEAPMTLFVAPGFADRTARLWWVELEQAVSRLDRVPAGEGTALPPFLAAHDAAAKARAFERLYWGLRPISPEHLLRAVSMLAAWAGVDGRSLVEAECLDWDGLTTLARHPLVTIGAHTLSHAILANCEEERVRTEMAGSREAIASRLGRVPRHVAYPVGDRASAGRREFAIARELGFASAVTTRPGVVFRGHAAHPHALPRISLNGLFQHERQLRTLLSGVPTLIWNRGRLCDAA